MITVELNRGESQEALIRRFLRKVKKSDINIVRGERTTNKLIEVKGL